VANATAGNSSYIDTAGVVGATTNAKVSYVIVTSSAAGGLITLQDNAGTPVTKVTFKVATDEETKVFDFSQNPIVFPNGVKASTVTDCVATVVYG
jgi:hypothetical protein